MGDFLFLGGKSDVDIHSRTVFVTNPILVCSPSSSLSSSFSISTNQKLSPWSGSQKVFSYWAALFEIEQCKASSLPSRSLIGQ